MLTKYKYLYIQRQAALNHRVNFLTKVLIVVFAFSLVSAMHNWGAKDLQRDLISLGNLKELDYKKLSEEADDTEIRKRVLNWLDSNSVDASQTDQPVGWTNRARLWISDLLSGNGSQPSQPHIVRHTIGQGETTEDVLDINIHWGQESTNSNVFAQTDPNPFVKDQIAKLDILSSPATIAFVRRTVRSQKGSKVSIRLPHNESRSWVFDASEFKQSSLASPLPPNGLIHFTASKDFNGPSIFALLVDDVSSVYLPTEDDEHLKHLRRSYGHLDFEVAISAMGAELAQVFRGTTIFGLTFSPRRFPIAVALFTSFTVLGIFAMTRSAEQPPSNMEGARDRDDIISLILKYSSVRILIWGFLPLISIAGSMPIYRLGFGTYSFMGLGALLAIILGSLAARRAGHIYDMGIADTADMDCC